MSDSIVLCVVGAGSSYTPELIDGMLGFAHADLPVSEIRMQDLDPARLEIMAGLARRTIAHAGRAIAVRSDTCLENLLPGATFVVTQIRVGGMRARHLDESIPPKYGLLGQETTGPGGLFKALRTIPPMLDIARAVERLCPDGFILNYTNPSGIVTEAIRRHTGARCVGLCSGIPGVQQRIAGLLHEEFGDVRSYCVGLNHLGFIHRVLAGGRDVTCQAMERLAELSERKGPEFGLPAPGDIRLLNAVSLGYLDYYLHRAAIVARVKAKGRTRAEEIMEIERRVLAAAADPATVGKPSALASRGGGGYADVTFRCMRAIHFDRGDELACTVLNRGTVDGLDDDAGVEAVCRLGKAGPTPVPVGPIPLAFRGLVQAVKACETLAVDAAVSRRRCLVEQALVNHPLAGDLDVIRPLVTEMLAAHGLAFDQ